jgi:ribosomal protein S20
MDAGILQHLSPSKPGDKKMKTRGFYLGTALMLVICFCAIVPAQAAGQADQSANMRGNATAWSAFGSLSDEISTLSQAGYEVTSLRASLDAAQAAAQTGDTETARTAIQELRTRVREAMQSGILSPDQLLQHREAVKNRFQNAVANGNGPQAQLRQNRQAVNAQGQNAVDCGNGSQEQSRQRRQAMNARSRTADTS